VADDIVTRLRAWSDRMIPTPLILAEAADEIERLRKLLSDQQAACPALRNPTRQYACLPLATAEEAAESERFIAEYLAVKRGERVMSYDEWIEFQALRKIVEESKKNRRG
jgi:hypothetical protein